MSYHQLIQELYGDQFAQSLWAFRPELTLSATVVLMLLVKMIVPKWKAGAFCVMLSGSTVALCLAAPWNYASVVNSGPIEIFSGMLIFDSFTIYLKALLLFFGLLYVTFTQMSGIPRDEDATEFYVLILGVTLGLCLMVASNHMLTIFLGVEMASVPSYILAGILKGRRRGSEAALKFAVFGAGTAGVMIYGISLLVGTLGSAHLPTMGIQLADMFRLEAVEGTMAGGRLLVLMLGGLMMMVGLAFKLSAVPFHFWTPDVFEGAPIEVGTFLSIASKTAALAVLVRVVIGLGYVDPARDPAPEQFAAAAVLDLGESDSVRLVAAENDALPVMSSVEALAPVRNYFAGLIALLAAVTCTFGNLAAYGQTNMKRLLAYSTIAHAGYMMMAVAAAVSLMGTHTEKAQLAIAGLICYAAIYLFMNLGAFSGVAFLRNALGSEQIADYAGLVRRSPGLAISMSVILFSLVGLPPLAGFAAKFTIFSALANAAIFDQRDPIMLTLLVIGGLNTALSLFYYLRVVKVMVMDDEPKGAPTATIPILSGPGFYVFAVTVPLLVLGIRWDGLFTLAKIAASQLF